MDVLILLFWACGITVLIFGMQSVVLFPLTVIYEIWKRRFFTKNAIMPTPFLSIIVPAYNEENTIVQVVESIRSSQYPAFEVIIVDDGSTDGTGRLLQQFCNDPRITCLHQANRGKGSALNFGISAAKGEIIFFTDADSLFRGDTIQNMARWFADPKIHAVCGDDTPLRPETPLQKLLTITTHVGTGYIRRALSVLNVMPIISGNCGAVRREYLLKIGNFTEGWGEDLDLTFKLHKVKARIVYDWETVIHCEVPRTFRTLWKQRIRWIRSYLKISALHKEMFFNKKYFPFSFYLPLNWFNVIAVPVLQSVMIAVLPFALNSGHYEYRGIIELLAFVGYFFFFCIAAYSILLDRRPAHLRLLPFYGWLIIPYSYFLNAVVVYSIYREVRHSSESWEKISRQSASEMSRRKVGLRRFLYPAGVSFAIVAMTLVSIFFTKNTSPAHGTNSTVHPIASLTLATHFDAWDRPDQALSSILARQHPEIVRTIAVGAGRVEWNYFRWSNHEESWSNHQKGSGVDLLQEAISTARHSGKGVIAIVDFYAPEYIVAHPEVAALGSDGARSSEQVCFMELTSGAYGARLKEMISYLSRNYAVEAISLTELDYRRYCYDDRCLNSFRKQMGNGDWPKTFFGGDVNKDNHALGEWRSEEMARFLKEIADTTHKYGKRLLIDVPVDYRKLDEEGMSHGLYYPRLLSFADGLIVWDYFYLEGRNPSASEEVAKFFITRYDPEKIIFSIGLWGKKSIVSPSELSDALHYEMLGGARQIWVTPNHLITTEHWDQLREMISVK